MMTYWRLVVWNQICAVSMVMFWSRSDWRASMRLAHSKGTPRRSATAWSCSSLPSGSEPVSWKKPADKGGFAVVHVADDDDLELLGGCGLKLGVNSVV